MSRTLVGTCRETKYFFPGSGGRENGEGEGNVPRFGPYLRVNTRVITAREKKRAREREQK